MMTIARHPSWRDGMSPEVRHLLEQSERAFRLAREMTNRADEEWLEQIGRYFLARRAASLKRSAS
jgi:hypothetical protein